MKAGPGLDLQEAGPADLQRRRLCLMLATLALAPLAGSGKSDTAATRPTIRTRPWNRHRLVPGNDLAG